MKTIFFEWSDYDQAVAQSHNIELPTGSTTTPDTFSLEAITDQEAISIKFFSNISNQELDRLKEKGVKIIALRVAGFNMLDVDYADKIGLKVYRVAAYSPESIAEFAVTMMLSLARKMPLNRSYQEAGRNARDLTQMGFLLKGRKIGLHGYGKIAQSTAKILRDGFGAKISYYDPFFKGESIDKKIDSLQELYSQNQIVSVHVPLMKETEKCVNAKLFKDCPENFMLINTSRGGVICRDSVKQAMKEGKIKYLGVDVWGDKDNMDPDLLTEDSIQTYHIAFFTEEAVHSMITQSIDAITGNPRPENILPIKY
jgi:D-lactate dehydrogenase